MSQQTVLNANQQEACILCGDTESTPVVEMNGYHIVTCNTCKFVYTTPLPTEEDVRNFYLNEDKYETYKKKLTPLKRFKRRMRYKNRARFIKKFFPAGKKIRLLELGCYHGDFIHALHDDPQFDAMGIDIDESALRIARELGLNVKKGTLEDLQFENESFDCIYSCHVMEHVLDPISVINECDRILAKGGIYMAIVPSVSHIKYKIYGKKWKYFSPPHHLWYFSNETFKRYVEKVGLKTEYVSSFSNRSHLWIVARK